MLPQSALPKEEAVRSVISCILLSFVTCFIYNLIWNARQMRVMNGLLEREDFSFWRWFLFTLLTCGLYHIYYEYIMGRAMVEIQTKLKRPVDENMSVIGLALTLFGLSIVVDAIHQNEINKIYGA